MPQNSKLDERPTALTHVAFNLIGALETGKYDDISISEVKERIRSRAVFRFLEERLGKDIDLSLLGDDLRAELNDEWIDLANAVDETRKFGVQRNGILLLLAYVTEGAQRRLR